MIGSIIKLLLNQKGILEIPGLGTFKSEYAASNIQFATRTITPFTFQIEFSAKPTSGQDLELQNYLISEIGATSQQAENYIENFVSEVNRSLQNDRKFEIKDFGWLLLNIEGSIHFQMYQDFPYNLEAYGLKNLKAETVYSKAKVKPDREAPIIPLHPFDDEIPQSFERKTENKPAFKWASVAAVFIATIISLGSVYLLSQQNFSSDSSIVASKPLTQEATLVPVGKAAEETTVNKPVITTASVALPEKRVKEPRSTKVAADIKPISETFFVVAGSFQNEAKSDKLNKTLLKKGFQSEILSKNNTGFIRVSIGKFTNKIEAISYLSASQKDFDENLWILTNQ